jgi:hypothetical protein
MSAFSFLRNFSASKYYEAAQAGSLSGAVPFSAGVLFVCQGIALKRDGSAMTTQYLFGNAPESDDAGLSFRQLATTGQFHAAQGTVVQNSGPVDSAQALMADATGDATSQALANGYKSEELGSLPVTTGTVRQYATPKPSHAVLAIMVVDGTNQLLYINGQLVASTARNTTTSVNAFRFGLAPDAANMPADNCLIAGGFYHSAALTDGNVADLQQVAASQKDVPAGTASLGGALNLDYVWSVKTGNFDARASWVSRGGAATPSTMTRHGSWSASDDVLSADCPWL